MLQIQPIQNKIGNLIKLNFFGFKNFHSLVKLNQFLTQSFKLNHYFMDAYSH